MLGLEKICLYLLSLVPHGHLLFIVTRSLLSLDFYCNSLFLLCHTISYLSFRLVTCFSFKELQFNHLISQPSVAIVGFKKKLNAPTTHHNLSDVHKNSNNKIYLKL